MFSIKMEDEDQYKRRQDQKQQTRRHYYRDISLDALDDEKHYNYSSSNSNRKIVIAKEDGNKDDSHSHNSPIQKQEQTVRDDEHKEQGENMNNNDHHRQIAIPNTTTKASESRQQQQQQNHDIDHEKADSKQRISQVVTNNEKGDDDDDDDSINIGLLLTKNRNRILNQKDEFLKLKNLTNDNTIWEETFQCQVALLDLETSIDPVSSSSVSSTSLLKKESSLEYPLGGSSDDGTNDNDVSQLQDHVTTNRNETETTATNVSSTTVRFPSLTDIEEITTPDCQDVFKTVDDSDDVIDHGSIESSTRFIEYNGIHYDDDIKRGNRTTSSSTGNTEPFSNRDNALELSRHDLYNIDESFVGENYANVPALSALEYRLIQQNQTQLSDIHHLDMDYSMDRIPINDNENDAELEFVCKKSLQEYYQDQIPHDSVWNTDLSSSQPITNMALRGIDQFGLYPTQTVPHMQSNASANSHVSDSNGVHQNQHFIPHRQEDVSRQYNYNTADSISSNNPYHQHRQQYQPDNNIEPHYRVIPNRFQTQMINNTNRYNLSSTLIEQDLIHRGGSSTSSKDVITKDSLSSDKSSQHRSEYDKCNDTSSPVPLSPMLSRTTTMLDNVRLAAVNGAESSTISNDDNKEKIEIEVSPGVFLPLHGSEETQQAMYEALLKSFNSMTPCGGGQKEVNKNSTTEQNVNTNGLVKCTCLSCSTTLYCIGKAVAVVCYQCFEISPISTTTTTTKPTTSNNENAIATDIAVDSNTNNDITSNGIGLGISEQSYLDLVDDISKKFTTMNQTRPTNRVRQISLFRLGQNVD